jgi:[ribosomal protein S5]-alanine N-acetyltransferase
MNYLLTGVETDRLIFREIQKSNFKEWLKFFQDPTTSIHWIEEKKSPEEECNAWYQKQFWRYKNEMGGMNALIEKASGKLIGHCGLLVQTVDDHTELEIGYSLLSEFWGKGYASEAAIMCRDYTFQNDLSESLISIISLANIPSQNVAMKNGMVIEKETNYKANRVYIFRINKRDWRQI